MKWLDAWHNRRQLAKAELVCDQQPQINGRILVALYGAPARLVIRPGVIINSGPEANPVGGERTSFILMNRGAEIVLDDEAGMSNVTIAAATRVRIGKRVFLGAGTRIYDTDFHSIHDAERLPDNVGIPTKAIDIGDRVFIGAFSTILKGVTIGEDSIIGACSLVTKSIPPGEIWGGSPARFLKKLPPYERRDVPRFVTPPAPAKKPEIAN